MIPDANPSRPREQFVAADVQFVGEQDGPPEQELKRHLAPLFKDDRSIHRAYLARVAYSHARGLDVALCLATTNPDVTEVNEKVGHVFAGIFRRDAHLDIVFLSPNQEAEIAKVCSAFYDDTR